MTEDEAKKYMLIEKECINRDCDRDCANCDIVQNVEDLNNAYDIAINALEKQIAKKPILKHDISVMHINRGNQPHEWKRLESDNWHCPECDSFVGERVYVHDRHHDQRKKKYCDNCGQKLNWESDK